MLKDQLFFGEKPEESKFEKIKNKYLFNKPYGGLWTSTYLGEHGSEWLQWSLDNEWYGDNMPKAWLVTPKDNLRVLTIDSNDDLMKKLGKYIGENKEFTFLANIDFEAVKLDWDVIHLTGRGEAETRLTMKHSLYGWDCESCLWLTWGFDEVKEIKKDWKEKMYL